MSRTAVSPSTGHMINLDKPLYTISVAAEILATHARTLMMYEHLGLVIPSRTATNRRSSVGILRVFTPRRMPGIDNNPVAPKLHCGAYCRNFDKFWPTNYLPKIGQDGTP